ncbi:MAG: hypothetical protein PVI59_02050 [Anaerolineae bacterium]|jgi:serine protease Do
MRYRRITLAIALLVIVAIACGGGEPPQPTVPPEPTEPSGEPAPAGELDYTLEPNAGSVDLRAGFTPDPHEVEMLSGGDVDVSAAGIGVECTGYATSAPDLRLNWSGSSEALRILFLVNAEGDDATLIINAPDGSWHCNDDYAGFDPAVEIDEPVEGQYDIWVGSYSSEGFVGGTLYITERQLSTSELDFSAEPNFGTLELESGFTPDPQEVEVVSGGTVDVASLQLDGDCTGYATGAPDFRINWTGASANLRIFFVADGGEDATMIINDATASWYCNDDYAGLDPLVDIQNPPEGQYDIWVGSHSSDEFIPGTLYITEMDYTPQDLP